MTPPYLAAYDAKGDEEFTFTREFPDTMVVEISNEETSVLSGGYGGGGFEPAVSAPRDICCKGYRKNVFA